MPDKTKELPNQDAANKKPAPKDDAVIIDTVEEIGGPKGPEPTRYGDWENKGRVSDF